jgi:perosamine synthetase
MRRIKLFECSVAAGDVESAAAVLATGQIAAGPNVAALEGALAAYLGTGEVVCTGDMTHALVLALRLAGVCRGDDVLTLALNCMSSNAAIAILGARPIWVDVDPQTATMATKDAVRAMTDRTRAVVVYHVAGYPADLTDLRRLCDERGICLIEDANNALGARSKGEPVGVVGDFAILSFYPNRQINALEGGALVCRDPAHAAEARRLRRFGIDAATFRDRNGEIDPAADVPEIGVSSPMNNVNAAVGLGQVADLDVRLDRNRRNVARLTEGLEPWMDIQPIEPLASAEPAYWVLLVRSQKRNAIMAALKADGVDCSRLHQRNDRYSGFEASARSLPGTEILEVEMFALPCGWWLDDDDIDELLGALKQACRIAQA